MKLKHPHKVIEYNVQDFLAICLDGSDYDRGSVETAQATANNVSEAFSRLVSVLVERKLLSQSDVYQIGLGYNPKDSGQF